MITVIRVKQTASSLSGYDVHFRNVSANHLPSSGESIVSDVTLPFNSSGMYCSGWVANIVARMPGY